MAIYAYGADSSNYLTNLGLYDLIIHDWGYTGIRLKFVSDFWLRRNRIYDVFYEGIAGLSVLRRAFRRSGRVRWLSRLGVCRERRTPHKPL